MAQFQDTIVFNSDSSGVFVKYNNTSSGKRELIKFNYFLIDKNKIGIKCADELKSCLLEIAKSPSESLYPILSFYDKNPLVDAFIKKGNVFERYMMISGGWRYSAKMEQIEEVDFKYDPYLFQRID